MSSASSVARPDRGERAVGLEEAEQVVEPVVERVRVALEVEEQVARDRAAAAIAEAALGLDRRQQLVKQPSVLAAPALDLDPRLLADPLERAAPVPSSGGSNGIGSGAELDERVDAACHQRLPLPAADPGDQARGGRLRGAGPCIARPSGRRRSARPAPGRCSPVG